MINQIVNNPHSVVMSRVRSTFEESATWTDVEKDRICMNKTSAISIDSRVPRSRGLPCQSVCLGGTQIKCVGITVRQK